MYTEPVTIEGVAGPVVVNSNAMTGKNTLTVGGAPVPGGRRGRFELPAVGGGTVPAKVRTNLMDPYPTIEVAGVKHRTGPASPLVLKILGLLPFGLIAGGLVGALLGFAAVTTNLAVTRTDQPTVVKAVLMIVVLMAAIGAYLIVVGGLSALF